MSDAQRALDHLASNPKYGTTSVDRSALKEIMLSTGGEMLAHGRAWIIEKNALGAGVYRLTLKEKP